MEGCLAEKITNLKIGCKVILLKNLSTTHVNGSIGTVVRWINKENVAPAEREKVHAVVLRNF